MLLTQEELMNHVFYNKETGEFIRIGYRDCHGNLVSCNYEITGVNKNKNGYKRVNILGKRYLLHKLAFLYTNGYIPEFCDHIDGNKMNNRFENLREVSHQENMLNKKLYSNNPHGYVGVGKKENKYYVHIQKNGHRKVLSGFKNIKDAIEKRKQIEKEMGFHKNHGTVR
jgi:hypothetical protein